MTTVFFFIGQLGINSESCCAGNILLDANVSWPIYYICETKTVTRVGLRFKLTPSMLSRCELKGGSRRPLRTSSRNPVYSSPKIYGSFVTMMRYSSASFRTSSFGESSLDIHSNFCTQKERTFSVIPQTRKQYAEKIGLLRFTLFSE